MTLEKNAIIETTIEGIGINGEGIAKVDGMTVFIPYTLPGERIIAKIVAVKKTHAYATATNILTPADERARAECPVFAKCGGCQLQHMKYKDQLAFKTIIVKDTLKKVARINFDVPPCIKSDKKYGYRNKLQMPIGINKKNNSLIVGFYANNSHRIVNVNSCPLHPEWNEKLIGIIKKFMTKHNIAGYNEEKHIGVVRHVVARQVAKTLQIIIVINADKLNFTQELITMLNKNFESPSIYLNINKEQTNVVLGDTYIHLSGDTELFAVDMGHKILVSQNSFLQVNDSVKTKLYNKAIEISNPTEEDVVIDAYCGIGILTSQFAEHAKYVFGIEIVESAIKNADFIAKENLLTHKMTNVLGDCKVELPKILNKAKELTTTGDIILVLDPPRKGVDREVIDCILKELPNKIVYISCNISTLSRDIGMLVGTIDMEEYKTDQPRYQLEQIQPYDMFPQTKHVESLVYLTRKF